MTDKKTIEQLTHDELVESLKQQTRENRRLRQILDGMARAGTGKGAIVELYAVRETEDYTAMGVLVCRPDVDEVAFLKSLKASIDVLFKEAGFAPVYRPVMPVGTEDLDASDARLRAIYDTARKCMGCNDHVATRTWRHGIGVDVVHFVCDRAVCAYHRLCDRCGESFPASGPETVWCGCGNTSTTRKRRSSEWADLPHVEVLRAANFAHESSERAPRWLDAPTRNGAWWRYQPSEGDEPEVVLVTLTELDGAPIVMVRDLMGEYVSASQGVKWCEVARVQMPTEAP